MLFSGPNRWQQSIVDDTLSPADLSSRQVVLHYDAKANQNNVILDLSPNENHGRLVGRKFATWDIKVASGAPATLTRNLICAYLRR